MSEMENLELKQDWSQFLTDKSRSNFLNDIKRDTVFHPAYKIFETIYKIEIYLFIYIKLERV